MEITVDLSEKKLHTEAVHVLLNAQFQGSSNIKNGRESCEMESCEHYPKTSCDNLANLWIWEHKKKIVKERTREYTAGQ